MPSGLVHTVMESGVPVEGAMEILSFDEWYVGAVYDGVVFRRLSMVGAVAVIGQAVGVVLEWQGRDGAVVPVDGSVDVVCGALREVVQVVDGRGVMSFTADEAGVYLLEAVSPEGCRAHCEVVVS